MTKTVANSTENAWESCNFTQLGLDFISNGEYINSSQKEGPTMNNELFATLDQRITELLEKYNALKKTNHELAEENQRLKTERESLKSSVDSILNKLEGI